jgi:hypothetical protein
VQQVPEHIFTGSFGATVTPPDDYQWMWNAVVGNPDEDDETADNKTGAMFIGIWTDFNDHFRPWAGVPRWGTISIHPRPMVACKSGDN